MELSVGDQIMHPKHGVGQITGVQHQELVEGFEHYYIIEIPKKRLKMHIPVGRAGDVGIRPIMQRAKLAKVIDTLRQEATDLPKNNKHRQAQLRKKLSTGRPLLVAEVVRDLNWRKEKANLTKADTDMLNQGRDLLAAEIALVEETELLDASQIIKDALEAA